MSKTYKRDDGTVRKSKLAPQLKMIANGNFDVNRIRSEFKGNIALKQKVREQVCRNDQSHFESVRSITGNLKKGDFEKEQSPDGVYVNVFVDLKPDFKDDEVSGIKISNRLGNQAVLQIPISRIDELGADPNIVSVESPQQLKMIRHFVSSSESDKPQEKKILASRKDNDSAVIIGIIDVGGFDFSHEDFLDEYGNTRFDRIWDQGTEFRPPPDGFTYGSEFTEEMLNKALKSDAKLHPRYLEPQSQMAAASHGTHVTSIAAGNSGVCPFAKIIGVTIALDPEESDRRMSFYDSSRLADAITYLLNSATEHKLPISINISLGTNGHAHDGSSAINRWIDRELTIPGRIVSVAAGNAGQESKLHEDDLGYIMGRIHTSGQITHQGLSTEICWKVVGNGLMDISENELEIWYESQDRFSIEIKPPKGNWLGPIYPNEYIENQQLKDGSFLSIYSELFHPSNGKNYIGIYLSPNLNDEQIIGIPAGDWKIRLRGIEIRDGNYHAWIERDDPRRLGRVGNREAWRFPSYFSEESNVDASSVSTLACAANVISVGNYNKGKELINPSSSQGPTMDRRLKPEIIASGTDIVAAKGFYIENDPWISMTGTSMASPFVCGVAALMLSVEPNLTAAQITGIMRKTSKPLTGENYSWKNDIGFGLINPKECIKEARKFFERKDLTIKRMI